MYSGEAADATARVLKEVKLRPGEFHQFNQVLDVLGSTANGYVKVERVEGSAPFYAYGVINDQANSDGSFIFPVTASSLAERTGQTLPVIVETSAFRSELTVTNFSEEPRTLDFQFVAEGIETDDKTAGFSMTLEAASRRSLPRWWMSCAARGWRAGVDTGLLRGALVRGGGRRRHERDRDRGQDGLSRRRRLLQRLLQRGAGR